MADTLSERENIEMILLTCARAEENGTFLTAETLAREWSATTTAHLQALAAQSLITLTGTGTVILTPEGRARARDLLRRHRLVERHATDVLGLDWSHAHEHADHLEHRVSAEEVDALATQLGDPATCPHGNPIPSTSQTPNESLISLAQCAERTRGIITRISVETRDALRHLATLGLLPNVSIEVEQQAPLGGPVLVRVGRSHYALGRDLAARIWIKKEE